MKVFNQLYDLETVSLRYFNVFGPRQDPTSQYSAVIPKFITSMLRAKVPTIYGDGEQSRDFTYVTNVVNANLLACTAEGAAGEEMNVACHEKTTLNELVNGINEILGTLIAPDYADPRMGDVKHSYAAVDKARDSINYTPETAFMDGLRQTIAFFQS
jgi:UDP-glucose 4-epimerase